MIPILLLDMRIYNGNKLSFRLVELLQHSNWVGESMRIPSEILLIIGVLDIEPNDIVWDLMLAHLPVHILDILVCVIVPPALMIGNGEFLW